MRTPSHLVFSLFLPTVLSAGCTMLQPTPAQRMTPDEPNSTPASEEAPQVVSAEPPKEQWNSQDAITAFAERMARQSESAEPAAMEDVTVEPPMIPATWANPAEAPRAVAENSATLAADARPAAAPPTLTGLKIRVDEPATLSNDGAGAAQPLRANAPSQAQSEAQAQIAQMLRGSSLDADFRRQLDARVLAAVSGDLESARKPLELVSTQQQKVASQFIEALIAMREGHGGDPAAEAGRLLAQINQLRDALRPLSDLEIRRLAVCRNVVGFGLYDPIEPAEFAAGSTMEFVLYCEIHELAAQKSDNGWETQFDVTVRVLSSAGETVYEQRSADVRTRWRDERHECFIAPVLKLPATLNPGSYVAKITVADKIGSKVAEKTAPLRVLPAR